MSDEVRESGRCNGGACSGAKSVRPTSDGRSLKDKAKPFCITRIEVLEAYFKVKSNKGATGIDEQTIEDFERNLKRNQLAQEINPKLREWFNYYGRFNPSALRPIDRHVGQSLVRWACRQYKTLFHHRTRAWAWLLRVVNRQPDLLALWEQQRWAVSTMAA